jgi:hypothetical protein
MDMIRASTKQGLVQGPQELLTKHSAMCGQLVGLFLQSKGLVVFAGIALVVVNSLLESIIMRLNSFQRHQSRTGASFSLMIKLFLAQFANTALVVLLVNASLPLFDGDFGDFTLEWHVQVGAQMMTTLFANMLGSHAVTVLNCIAWQPLRRYFLLRQERHNEVTQKALLSRVSAPPFCLEAKYAAMLSNIAVILLFSTSYPILYFLGFCTLVISFYAEKLLILRFYEKPQPGDPRQAEVATRVLQAALLLHAAFGFWMLGASGVISSHWFGANHVWQMAGQTGPEQQAAVSEQYESPSAAAKAERDSSIAVGELASTLKQWSLKPAWDFLGLVPRIASIAGLGLFFVCLTCALIACWSTSMCKYARYGSTIIQAQDVFSCEKDDEGEDDTMDVKTYTTVKGVKLPIKQTKQQEKQMLTEDSCLNPPFSGEFSRMLPPIPTLMPRPSLCSRICLRVNFNLPCALACFSQRDIRHVRRWARHQNILKRKTSNRFANKLKDSSSDGDIEGTSHPPRSASVSAQATVGAGESAVHFELGKVQGMPLWRPGKSHRVSKTQKAMGWQLTKDKSRHPHAVRRVQEWNDISTLARAQAIGKARKSIRPGTLFSTWEMIESYGLSSYDISRNPHYSSFSSVLQQARQIRNDGQVDFVFEEKLSRVGRLKHFCHSKSIAYAVVAAKTVLQLWNGALAWYISCRGGDPNAKEQAQAAADLDSDDDSYGAVALASASEGLAGTSEKHVEPESAKIPQPMENYELFVARKSSNIKHGIQRLLSQGFRRTSNAGSATVAPSLMLGILSSNHVSSSSQDQNPMQVGSSGGD